MIGAKSIEKIEAIMIFKGSIKKEDFYGFMIFLKQQRHNIEKDNTIFYVMDNAKIHHSKDYMKKLFLPSANVIYNASYSPQLNSIEFCFNKVKKIVKMHAPKN